MDGSLRRLLEKAEAQHSLLTTRDASSCGVTRGRLHRLVRSGFLVPVHRGVMRVATSSGGIEQRVLAACLACGPGAVGSHRTAGALWGFLGEPGVTEVTLPRARCSVRSGIVVHRSKCLAASEVGKLRGVPVTGVERTLSDLAGLLGPLELERALDDALRAGIVTPRRLVRYVRGAPSNWKGIRLLSRLAEDRARGGVPGSELEAAALRVLRLAGFPEPQRQYRVVTDGREYRIDLAFPQARVAIELVGRAPHWGRERWQRDHDRHYHLEVAGWRPIYFTWQDVFDRPLEVVFRVAEALDLWPKRLGPAPFRARKRS